MARVLLRLPEVIRRTGSNSSAIYEGMKNGTFPKSVPTGPRTVAWIEDEVSDHIDALIARRDAQHPREQRRRKGGPGRGHKGPLQTTVPTS
jgi:prophage regulatory protein